MNPIQLVAEKAVRTTLRSTFKVPGKLPIPLKWLAKTMNAGAPLFKVRQDARVEYLELGTCMCALVRPANSHTDQVLLHMHGGAFFAGSLETHLPLASELAVRCNARVFLIDYRLAPEHPYPAALEDGIAAYQALLDLDVDAKKHYFGRRFRRCCAHSVHGHLRAQRRYSVAWRHGHDFTFRRHDPDI